MQLTIKAGSNFIDINPGGIFISGTPFVMINSGGSAGSGSGSSPDAPKDPKVAKEAATDQPGEVTQAQATPIQKQGQSLDSVTVGSYQSPQAQTLVNAAPSGTPFCEVCEEARQQQQRAARSPESGS
jgi:type VI secretion system secreted protein VgrG